MKDGEKFTPRAVCVVNDCSDDNTRGRQGFRLGVLLGLPTTYVGVPKFNGLAAAGNVLDMLDAAMGTPSVLLVNVAPRFGADHSFENGTPFGYFWYKSTLVVTTISGYTMSLVKKFGLTEQIKVVDLATSVPAFVEAGMLSKTEGETMLSTQFRSFNFLPRVAQWFTMSAQDLPFKSIPITDVADAPRAIWWIDNFGNCKTTLTTEDVDWKAGNTITLLNKEFTMYDRLKDVPDGEVACIVGSSGLGEGRFLELVIQGKSASDQLGLTIGQSV